jgi:hypothetical protein
METQMAKEQPASAARLQKYRRQVKAWKLLQQNKSIRIAAEKAHVGRQTAAAIKFNEGPLIDPNAPPDADCNQYGTRRGFCHECGLPSNFFANGKCVACEAKAAKERNRTAGESFASECLAEYD